MTYSYTIVNVGSSPNDATGDGLRNAFIKINNNFANINAGLFLVGNVTTGVLDVSGAATVNSLTVNAVSALGGNLVVAGNAVIQKATSISGIVTANSGVTSNSTSTGALVVAGGVGASGNLYLGGNFSLNGLTIASPNYITVSANASYSLSSTVTDNFLLVVGVTPLTATLNLPSTPVDGQVCIFSSNANVTLSLGSGNVNIPYAGAVPAGFFTRYIYRAASSTWFKG
jgi:hypothetical protein